MLLDSNAQCNHCYWTVIWTNLFPSGMICPCLLHVICAGGYASNLHSKVTGSPSLIGSCPRGLVNFGLNEPGNNGSLGALGTDFCWAGNEARGTDVGLNSGTGDAKPLTGLADWALKTCGLEGLWEGVLHKLPKQTFKTMKIKSSDLVTLKTCTMTWRLYR